MAVPQTNPSGKRVGGGVSVTGTRQRWHGPAATFPRVPQDAVDDLVQLLDLEPIEVNIFRGVSPDEDRQRIFGGQVAGQALVAAARTVDADRHVHSLHAYFLRAGDPRVPVLYEVDRIRDGGSFTTRRVVAIQHGQAIFNMAASFQVPEEGFDHAFPDARGARRPRSLPTMRERFAPAGDEMAPWMRPAPARSTSATSTGAAAGGPRSSSPARTCGCGPTAGCPTTRSCTRSCSPTRRT